MGEIYREIQPFDDFLSLRTEMGYPREVGLNRQVVNSYAEYMEYAREQIKHGRPAYVSLFSHRDIERGWFRVGFVDIDLPHPLRKTGEIKSHARIIESMLENRVPLALIVYSGGRGFHVYISLDIDRWARYKLARGEVKSLMRNVGLMEELVREDIVSDIFLVETILRPYIYEDLVKLEESRTVKGFYARRHVQFYKSFVTKYVEYLFKDSGYWEYVDRHCLGDIRRMVKVPLSWGSVGQAKVISRYEADILDGDMLETVIKFAKEAERDAVEKLEAWANAKVSEEVDVMANMMKFPPCIANMVAKMVETGELSHFERFQVAAYLLSIGWSEDEITDVFRAASDFNEQITRYQISHIKSGGYRPAGCSRTINMGACPGICGLYPKLVLNGVRYGEE